MQQAIARQQENTLSVVGDNSAEAALPRPKSMLPARFDIITAPVVRVFRLPWKWLLLFFVSIVPTLVTAIYLYGFASDQYISEFRFNLRSASSPPVSLPGGLQGGGAMSTLTPTIVWDSHVIAQFIKSEDVVAEIDKKFGFRALYRPDSADAIFRMPDAPSIEQMTRYWRTVADPFFDMQTGIISVKIRAFSPEDALKVANLVLELSEKTVNDMSRRSRQDTLAFARAEVAAAEDKLREAQITIRNFRSAREVINPVKEAEASMLILARQREEIGKIRTDLQSLRSYLDENAPPVRVLKTKLAALESALAEEQKKIVARTAGGDGKPDLQKQGDGTGTLSYALTDFETLMFEQTFRERSYALAQETLQKARIEADKQQLYLNAFVKPRLPEMSIYPQRGKFLAIVAFGSVVLWGLMCLVIFSIRDHI